MLSETPSACVDFESLQAGSWVVGSSKMHVQLEAMIYDLVPPLLTLSGELLSGIGS